MSVSTGEEYVRGSGLGFRPLQTLPYPLPSLADLHSPLPSLADTPSPTPLPCRPSLTHSPPLQTLPHPLPSLADPPSPTPLPCRPSLTHSPPLQTLPHPLPSLADPPSPTPLPCRPSLTHQRTQEEKVIKHDSIGHWYKKGVMENKKVTKFRKGACQNCGAITHKKKDCLEVSGCGMWVWCMHTV